MEAHLERFRAKAVKQSRRSLVGRLAQSPVRNALFDVNPNVDTSATLSRTTLGSSTSQSESQTVSQSLMPVPPQPQHLLRSHGYLVAQHERPEVLQAEKVITGNLTFRPTGMQSVTHRRLVRAVGQKHNKVARFRMANELVTSDPNIPARPRCTPRARPPLHHTHTPARPHLQATRPPIPHAMFWVSEKRSGGCLCITDTQQSFAQRPHARPSSFAGHAPALSSRHARPPSFAGHMSARPSCHVRPP